MKKIKKLFKRKRKFRKIIYDDMPENTNPAFLGFWYVGANSISRYLYLYVEDEKFVVRVQDCNGEYDVTNSMTDALAYIISVIEGELNKSNPRPYIPLVLRDFELPKHYPKEAKK